MFSIRRANANDAHQVHFVRNQAIRTECSRAYPAEVVARWTEGDAPSEPFVQLIAASFYVADVGGEIAASGAIDLATGKLDAIFVSPSHMRRGLARSMIAFLEQIARQSGLDRLHLESTLNAVDFYVGQGFVKVRDAKYNSPRGFSIDCVVMEKLLRRAVT